MPRGVNAIRSLPDAAGRRAGTFGRACFVGVLLALVTGGGCRGSPEYGEAVDRDTFLEVYTELRRLQLETSDEESFAQRRAELMEARRLTDADLVAFVEARAAKPGYLAELWTELETRLASNGQARSQP